MTTRITIERKSRFTIREWTTVERYASRAARCNAVFQALNLAYAMVHQAGPTALITCAIGTIFSFYLVRVWGGDR